MRERIEKIETDFPPRSDGSAIRVLADAIGDAGAERAFAAWPLRYYVLQGGKITFKSMPDLETLTYPIEEWEAAIVEAARCV